MDLWVPQDRKAVCPVNISVKSRAHAPKIVPILNMRWRRQFLGRDQVGKEDDSKLLRPQERWPFFGFLTVFGEFCSDFGLYSAHCKALQIF